MGASLGYSQSKNRASSSSSQDIWGGQAPYLQDLYKQGQGFLESQMAGGDYGSQFQAPAFAAWQQMMNPQGNPYLQGQVQNAQWLAGEGFSNYILPALQSSAVAGGNLGGSRGGIAAGMAAQEAQRQQGDIATQFYGQAYQGDMQRALQALGMTGGLAGLQGASWSPLMQYAALLGRPTVLGESSSTSKGDSFGFNMGIAK